MVAARLTDRPGSSAYVAGGVVSLLERGQDGPARRRPAADRGPRRGVGAGGRGDGGRRAASASAPTPRWRSPVSRAPAAGVPRSRWARSASACSSPTGTTLTRTLLLPGNRSDIRERSTTVAMHLLRRVLLAGRRRLSADVLLAHRCRTQRAARSSCRRWPGRSASARGALRRADEPQRQGHHAERVLCRAVFGQHRGPARHRPRPGALQLPGRRGGRRRRTRRSTTAPTSASCCSDILERHDAVQRRLPTPRRARQGGRRRCARCTRGRASGAPSTCSPSSTVSESRAGQRLPDPAATIWTSPTSSNAHRQVLTATDQTTVPCNNDLLAANFVEDGDTMWLIDYEYSGNNDPCFELGNTSCECQLSAEQREELVTAYYGRTTAAQDRPGPAAGHRRHVRLDAVGLHPERFEPTGLRLLGVGHGAVRSAVAEFKGPTSTHCSTTCRHRTDEE